MKKIFLFLCLFILTIPNVSVAYQIVNYNSAGGVTSVTNTGMYGRNYYNTTTNPQFGSNAAFTPQNRAIAGERMRRIENEEKYLDSLKNSKNINVNVNTNRMYNPYRGNRYLYNNNGYYYNNRYNHYNSPGGYFGNNGIYYNQRNGFSIPGVRMF